MMSCHYKRLILVRLCTYQVNALEDLATKEGAQLHPADAEGYLLLGGNKNGEYFNALLTFLRHKLRLDHQSRILHCEI